MPSSWSIIKKNIELIFWISALLTLAVLTNPYETQSHFSLCLFRFLGFESCMGCGIGHAISFLFRLDFIASWQAHPMGIPVLVILNYRIYQLSKRNIKK